METYGSLEEQLRARLDETLPRAWSQLRLIQWIYDGAKDIARKSECLETTSSIAAVTSPATSQYTLPTDVVRVHRVEWIPTSGGQVYPLEIRDFHNMDSVWWTSQTITQSRPQFVTFWGFPPQLKLVVFPMADVVGAFKVFYYQIPTSPMSSSTPDTQTCTLPEGWSDVALDYAEMMALRMDGDPRWQEAKALYDERLGDLMLTAQAWHDQAGMIDTPSGGLVPAWLSNPYGDTY